jgi:beta-glucosidase
MSGPLARLVFPSLRFRRGGFGHERPKIDAALAAGVGGFIVFGGTPAAVAALTREHRTQAGRPLLIGADLERGASQQVRGLTDMPPPAALGYLDDLEASHAAALITATEARAVGIHIEDRFLTNGRLDTAAMQPIARFGYNEYAVVTTLFEMVRPQQ